MTILKFRLLGLAAVLAGAALLVACQPQARVVTGEEYGLPKPPPYSGPKAKMAVLAFRNKAAGYGWWGGYKMGSGMADMLTTALFRTNRFILLERQDLDRVMDEQDWADSGRFDPATLPPKGKLEGAELLVVGAVTGFKDLASGVGVGAGIPPLLGGVGAAKSWMSMDIKVVDAATGRIVVAGAVEGDSSHFLGGALVLGLPLGVGFGGWEGTPKEKALRACLEQAARLVANQVPKRYYRY